MRFKSFKAGKLQQISNISGGKPVLLCPRHFHPDPLGKGDEWFPKMVISCYQHASMPLAKRRQISQGLKDIHRITDVVKEDVIEFFVWLESPLELFLVRESDGEFEGWTSLLCDFYNLRTDVNAFTLTGLENRQKIAGAAANRENLFLRLNAKPIFFYLNRFDKWGPKGFVACFHVGQIDIGQHVGEQRQKFVADHVPKEKDTMWSSAHEPGSEYRVGFP